MYFYVYNGKSSNRLTGEARVYHYAIIEDKQSDMKGISIKQDVFSSPGDPENCLYTDERTVTGSGHLSLRLGLYDENGIGKNRHEQMKQLESKLDTLPPVSPWGVVGMQVVKTITILPLLWDLIYGDEAIVPQRDVMIYRSAENGKIYWSIARENAIITSQKGKIVLSLISAPTKNHSKP